MSYNSAEIKLAEELRQIFEQERCRHDAAARKVQYLPPHLPRFGGHTPTDSAEVFDGVDPHGFNKTERLWIRLSRKLLAERVDPRLFVRHVFRTYVARKARPQINHLLSDDALQMYRTHLHDTLGVESLEMALRAERRNFESEMQRSHAYYPKLSAEDLWAVVLCGSDTGLTALFRYCTAAGILAQQPKLQDRVQFDRVLEMARVPAALQYMMVPDAYDTVWAKLLPSGFRQTATRLYQEHYGLIDPNFPKDEL